MAYEFTGFMAMRPYEFLTRPETEEIGRQVKGFRLAATCRKAAGGFPGLRAGFAARLVKLALRLDAEVARQELERGSASAATVSPVTDVFSGVHEEAERILSERPRDLVARK